MSVEIVDVALRMLARDCAAAGSGMPQVRAARLTAEQFDLYLAEPAPLPPPWSGTADATVWTLEVDHTDLLDEIDVSEVAAPWPSLVTIGNDEEDGHVLLDLEHLGTLGVTGDPDTSRQVFAALAVELATSIWADDLQVTIVGNFPSSRTPCKAAGFGTCPLSVESLKTSSRAPHATARLSPPSSCPT